METVIVTVVAGEQGATTLVAAMKVACTKSPENYGLLSYVFFGRQWKFTFKKVR